MSCVQQAVRPRTAYSIHATIISTLLALCTSADAQTMLEPIVVQSQPSSPAPTTNQPDVSAEPSGFPGGAARKGALTVPDTEERIRELATVPGTVTVVTDDYKDATPAKTIKDALDYVPGVFAQPKWGDDTRLSVRASGLSRNFHLRGLNLYMDGIPINTADGFGDFQELDPTAFRYIEVYKGANGERFGSTSLGGAINFVTPTGYDSDLFGASVDIGSFGFHRIQANSGGVSGPVDYFITGSAQEQDGFRDHSQGDAERVHANLGYRLSPNAETRFYLNANRVRQDIPGAVDKDTALNDPKKAAGNLVNDYQRNIDTLRFANKTTIQVAPDTVMEVGAFALDRHLMHPIFQWLDWQYYDYGGFARVMNESTVAGHKNRLLVGINQHNGTVDADNYANIGGEKGVLLGSTENTSTNTMMYVENAFYLLSDLALVAGTQFFHARRELEDNIVDPTNPATDASGENSYTTWNPKVGVLWEIDPTAQIYANVARSAEAPSFGENSSITAAPFEADLQTAVTYEIGTRGRRPDYSWDVAVYRAELDNELLCIAVAGTGSCAVRNAGETIHRGVELGFGLSMLKGIMVDGDEPDRLWLNVAYTYNDFRYDDDATFGDNDLPGAPHHVLRAELLYKHPSGFFFGPNIEWVPEAYYVDSANTTKTESYVLLGLKGGYDAGNGFSLYVEGRNLTDEKYIASVSIADKATEGSLLFEPGTSRAIYVGVKYQW